MFSKGKEINQINLDVLKRTIGYNWRKVCFFLDASVPDTSGAISYVFFDFLLRNSNMLLIKHLVCFMIAKVCGTSMKLFIKSLSQLCIIYQNNSFLNRRRILIFEQLDVKKITILVIIYKVLTSPVEILNLYQAITHC